jgi:hypothetical protein
MEGLRPKSLAVAVAAHHYRADAGGLPRRACKSQRQDFHQNLDIRHKTFQNQVFGHVRDTNFSFSMENL